MLLWSQNLDKLMKLKLLDLQTNRLTAIEGLECLVNLEELYLSRNHLEEIQGLDSLVCESTCKGERESEGEICCLMVYNISQVNLHTLDLSDNKISRLKNISHLTKLAEFWVSPW